MFPFPCLFFQFYRAIPPLPLSPIAPLLSPYVPEPSLSPCFISFSLLLRVLTPFPHELHFLPLIDFFLESGLFFPPPNTPHSDSPSSPPLGERSDIVLEGLPSSSERLTSLTFPLLRHAYLTLLSSFKVPYKEVNGPSHLSLF